MKSSKIFLLTVALLCCSLLAACNDRGTGTAAPATTTPTATPVVASSPATTPPTTTGAHMPMTSEATTPNEPLQARADLAPTEGSNVRGTVTFTEVADGVRIEANITGLTPGAHGFHVHEKGDCSAPDATSAGDHFNPSGQPHGAPDEEARHDGDMGNVEADASGVATLSYIDHSLSLVPGDRSVVGRAVIVHADPDDLTSQPSGNAGARLACGVIQQTGTAP